jgi:hypothetical protein
MSAQSQVVFQVRLTMPGAEPTGATITGEQMTRTIDKAHAHGEYKGWCAAMSALRAAADEQEVIDAENVSTAIAFAQARAPRPPA